MELSLRLAPGELLDLKAVPTRVALPKGEAETRLEALRDRLADAHERLWADRRHAVLVLLQGMDTSGKDRVIRRVASALLPQALEVHAFGVPTPEEKAHDFLWRYHARIPAAGRVGVFNRTWYESVLVERVDRLAAPAVLEARYGHIAAFERLLTGSGVRLLKVYLHLSRDEQAKRLEERRTRPGKAWKHGPGDLAKHGQYNEYLEAYEVAVARTTTDAAPWHVVPADHKPTRDLAVAHLLDEALRGAAGGPP